MNSITFIDLESFDAAVTALELDSTPSYELDRDNLTIISDDIDGIVDVLVDAGVYDTYFNNHEQDNFRTDAEADADALASAGWGTDEDYGRYDSDGGYDE